MVDSRCARRSLPFILISGTVTSWTLDDKMCGRDTTPLETNTVGTWFLDEHARLYTGIFRRQKWVGGLEYLTSSFASPEKTGPVYTVGIDVVQGASVRLFRLPTGDQDFLHLQDSSSFCP